MVLNAGENENELHNLQQYCVYVYRIIFIGILNFMYEFSMNELYQVARNMYVKNGKRISVMNYSHFITPVVDRSSKQLMDRSQKQNS